MLLTELNADTLRYIAGYDVQCYIALVCRKFYYAFREYFKEQLRNIVNIAAGDGFLSLIKSLYKYHAYMDYRTYNRAARNGHLDLIKDSL